MKVGLKREKKNEKDRQGLGWLMVRRATMVKMGVVGMASVREGRRGSNKEKMKEKDERKRG